MNVLVESFHFPKLGSRLITLSIQNNLNFLSLFNANDNLSFFLVFFISHELDIRDVLEPVRDITLTTIDLLTSR